VITPLEPDILEWEIERAIGNITTNKASGGDEISVELPSVVATKPPRPKINR